MLQRYNDITLQRTITLLRYVVVVVVVENGIVRVRLYGSNRTVQFMDGVFFFG